MNQHGATAGRDRAGQTRHRDSQSIGASFPCGQGQQPQKPERLKIDDILHDCMDRLIRAGIAPDLVIKTIAELRRDWGSDAPYVCKIDRRLRDKTIAECLTAGLPVEVAAKKAGCSVKTIQRRRSEWSI